MDQQRTEAQLAQSGDLQDFPVEEVVATHTGVLHLDASRNIVRVNACFAGMTGYCTDELKGRSSTYLDSGYNSSEQLDAMWAYVDAGNTWHGTNRYLHKSGKDVWVKMTLQAQCDATGNISGYNGACTDVTDLMGFAKENTRLVSRAEYRRVVGRVYDINRADLPMHSMLAQALDILFEVPWLDVLSKGGVFLRDPEDVNALKLTCSHGLGQDIETLCAKVKFGHCLCGRAAQTRQMIHASCVDERHDVRFDAMQPHGHYNVPIIIGSDLVGVLVVYLEHGTKKNKDHEFFLSAFAHALGVLIGFKQREEELVARKQDALVAAEMAQKAMVEAQQAEAAKSNFLSTMSHELRTPMNGVVGMLHVLKMGELSGDQTESIDLALSSADLLLTIINDILDFTKLEHGAMSMEALPVDLGDVLSNVTAAFTPLAQEKSLKLHTRLDPNLPAVVLGDPTRLRQIINNFISNAIKFTENGDITLALEHQINDTDTASPDWLVLKVTDTGIGLDDKDADVIFDRFTQADNSISRKFGGTGLGLSICKQLAEAMSGTIGVDSTKGQGCSFWVKIPLHDATQKTHEISNFG